MCSNHIIIMLFHTSCIVRQLSSLYPLPASGVHISQLMLTVGAWYMVAISLQKSDNVDHTVLVSYGVCLLQTLSISANTIVSKYSLAHVSLVFELRRSVHD